MKVSLLEVQGSSRKILTRKVWLYPLIKMMQYRPIHRHYLKRGIRKLSVYALRILSTRGFALVRFGSDARFAFPITDEYWGRLVYLDANPYEKEVESLLRAVSDIPYVFFDLGANYGYWSVRVGDEEFGAHKALAVEASPSNANFLKMNQIENKYRFDVICKAVSDSNGEKVTISGANHAGKSIVSGPVVGKESVETITIDCLAAQYARALNSPIIIKLDIEGAEVASIEGATETLEKDSLVIYEDHGKDSKHDVTRRLLEIGSVFYFDGASLTTIKSANQLNRIKVNPVIGYNFVFTKSEYWLSVLRTRFVSSSVVC